MSLFALIPFVGSILDPIGRISELIAKSKLQEANNGTERERISAQERTRTLELRRDSLVLDPWAPHIRLGFAVPFVLYNIKLIVWDKLFSLGATDPLSPHLMNVEIAVIAFYFLHTIFKK